MLGFILTLFFAKQNVNHLIVLSIICIISFHDLLRIFVMNIFFNLKFFFFQV